MQSSAAASGCPSAPLHKQEEKLSAEAPPSPPPSALSPPPPSYDQAVGGTAAASPEPQVVVVNQATAVSRYGPHPVFIQCPHCHKYTRTRLRYRPSEQTHLIAVLLCLLQFCLVCLPFCLCSLLNVNHHCGTCDQYLGTHRH